ncbi:hypothetical protein [Streptomyces cucumeris]|uniref:hypothetical protein n=1 Tax=Streptomyces cucumeris TaxID=2962890 RepID=UPI0020C8B86A|nr:hypothetical protein [Streptomyces sp. NEAU-Y11]MCP9209687.1 hypothetical protein [Streptomyces sp. NEAU-Y11]
MTEATDSAPSIRGRLPLWVALAGLTYGIVGRALAWSVLELPVSMSATAIAAFTGGAWVVDTVFLLALLRESMLERIAWTCSSILMLSVYGGWNLIELML